MQGNWCGLHPSRLRSVDTPEFQIFEKSRPPREIRSPHYSKICSSPRSKPREISLGIISGTKTVSSWQANPFDLESSLYTLLDVFFRFSPKLYMYQSAVIGGLYTTKWAMYDCWNLFVLDVWSKEGNALFLMWLFAQIGERSTFSSPPTHLNFLFRNLHELCW